MLVRGNLPADRALCIEFSLRAEEHLGKPHGYDVRTMPTAAGKEQSMAKPAALMGVREPLKYVAVYLHSSCGRASVPMTQ